MAYNLHNLCGQGAVFLELWQVLSPSQLPAVHHITATSLFSFHALSGLRDDLRVPVDIIPHARQRGRVATRVSSSREGEGLASTLNSCAHYVDMMNKK